MYIKIKHIKQFLLILACIFFAGFNYLKYVSADNVMNLGVVDFDKDGLTDAEEKLYGTDAKNTDSDGDGYSDGVEVKSGYDPIKPAPGDRILTPNINTASEGDALAQVADASLTETFAQDFQTFVASKGDKPISKTDVNDFVNENLADKTGSSVTLESLPEMDSSQIKILKQEYGGLGETERKNKLQEDATAYYTKIIYILVSNAPRAMITNSDFDVFKQDFFAHVATLASTNADTTYFLDLAGRVDSALNQIGEIVVPESMLELHVKSIRIVKGFLSLRETADITNDPIAKMALLAKVQDLTRLTTDYLEIDFIKYVNSIK